MTEASTSSIVAQADALGHGAGLRLRNDLALVRVRGDDRVTWLNGQITADVRGLAEGDADRSVHGLCINVRGKIMAELWVLPLGDQLGLLLPVSTQPEVLASLERFIIMEDVVLEPDPSLRVLSVQGPSALGLLARLPGTAARVFRCDELGLGGAFVLGNDAELAACTRALIDLAASPSVLEVSDAGFELSRLRLGRPRFARDFDERSYPQEAGLKPLLSFNKGCYLGQEVVCTLESRGRLHRHLCALRAAGHHVLTPNAALSSATGDACGELTSVVHDPAADEMRALGYVKRAHAKVGNTLLSGETTWTVQAIVGENA